jgi:hypothetical protein
VVAVADLIVIVPSRERPESVHPLADAFWATCTADTVLLFVVDNSDPKLDEYKAAVDLEHQAGRAIGYGTGPSTTMVEALNSAAQMLVDDDDAPFAVGFMGDDHCPRTVGWDAAYLEALRELGTGLVYGNDLVQGERIPTQVAMTADIVRSLGWMAPPVLTHLYVDNFWLSLGRSADCVRYLPDVVVEHVHPATGKVAWDAGHLRVNESGMYARDEAAFRRFEADGAFAAAVETVRALRGAA